MGWGICSDHSDMTLGLSSAELAAEHSFVAQKTEERRRLTYASQGVKGFGGSAHLAPPWSSLIWNPLFRVSRL